MTIWEYMVHLAKQNGMAENFFLDSCGNAYVETDIYRYAGHEVREIVQAVNGYFEGEAGTGIFPETNCMFFEKEKMDFLNQYKIFIDETAEDLDVRRPYYRVIGKSVTKEQAFDMLVRTKKLYDFNFSSRLTAEELEGGWTLHPSGQCWLNPDGTIGGNANTGTKYPTMEEYIQEWLINILHYPYLNLVIALTDFNELLYDENYMLIYENGEEDDEFGYKDPQKAEELFYNNIKLGIYVHDKTVEILNAQNTERVYREYVLRYQKEDPALYCRFKELLSEEYIAEGYKLYGTLEDNG